MNAPIFLFLITLALAQDGLARSISCFSVNNKTAASLPLSQALPSPLPPPLPMASRKLTMAELQVLEDQELALIYQNSRDDRAWKILFHRYFPRLKIFLARFFTRTNAIDSSDGAMLVLASVWRNIDKFKPDAGKDAFKNWIFAIASNQGKNLLRHENSLAARHETATSLYDDTESIDFTTPEDMLITREQLARVSRVVSKLGRDDRIIFEEHFINGLNDKEIAIILPHRKPNNIRQRMTRIKEHIIKHMKEEPEKLPATPRVIL
ncbi:MAG: hypothetical protein C5B49_16010 [Bdellovibrio sp.]|nr:MAG: hypothetical protein C5B49_16010 [Bdellovibrio sp.]